MAKRLWIKGAIKRPGVFSAKAKRAGMSTMAYARKVTAGGAKRYGLRTFRQGVLARTLRGLPRPSAAARRRGGRRAAATRARRR